VFPILFKIGSLSIPTYAFFFAGAFIVGIVWARKRTALFSLPPLLADHLAILFLFFGILGGRIFFYLLYTDAGGIFSFLNPFYRGQIGYSGMVQMGGILAAGFSGIVFLKIKKIPLSMVLNWLAPVLPVSIGIGRIGCFFNGCCPGNKASGFFPFVYDFSGQYCEAANWQKLFHLPALLNVQLLTGFSLILIGLFIVWVERKVFRSKYLGLLAVLLILANRFIWDFFRIYPDRIYFGTALTYNQWIIILLSFSILVYPFFRPKKE